MSSKKQQKVQWTEFDCPECEANNPWTDGFSVGDTVVCMFCGQPFLVKRGSEEDRFRLVND